MPKARALSAVSAAGVLAAAMLVGGAQPASAATTCTRFFDVNRDGIEDTVVGTPMENVAPDPDHKYPDAGTVTIVRGTADGTFGSNDGTSLDMSDLGFSLGAGDHFGASVLVADLNGDQCGDLVIGVPGRSSGAGIVVVVYNAPPPAPTLGTGAVQILKQGFAGTGGAGEAGDGFGSSLAVSGENAAGGPTQLWVGAPGEDIGSVKDAGLVNVYPTTTAGQDAILPTTGITSRQQGSGGVPGKAEAGDKFGFSMAGSGGTVLVGSPGEDVGTIANAGMFHVFAGSVMKGYTADTAGVPGSAEKDDQLGRSVAVAESCKGGAAKAWVVGAPYEDVGSVNGAGNVVVMDRGTGTSLTLQQGAGVLNGKAEADDHFGYALNATGSVNRSRGVIAVGAPDEDLGTVKNAGWMATLSLTCPASTLSATGFEAWSRDDAAIAGAASANDQFARTLGATLVPVSGTDRYILLVSVPNADEDSENGTLVNSGTILTMHADADGFTSTGSFMFGQNTDVGGKAIPGTGEGDDQFGSALESASAGR